MSSPRRGPCAISQFWQKSQWNGQPAVATENASEPGSTWKSGFFSIGSTDAATTAPYAWHQSVPSRFPRTPQIP